MHHLQNCSCSILYYPKTFHQCYVKNLKVSLNKTWDPIFLLFSRTSDQSFIFHCLVCCAFTVVIAERVLCYWLVTVCAALLLFGNNYKIWEELMKWPVNLFSLHSYTFKVRQKYLLKCPQTHTYIDNIMHRHNQLIIYL